MNAGQRFSGRSMYLVQILLPCADNSGKAFPREDFEQVKAGLAERFEGVTAYLQAPAEGLWREGRRWTPDDIIIFEVMTDEVDLAEWRERRARDERHFKQERVIIRYMSIAVV